MTMSHSQVCVRSRTSSSAHAQRRIAVAEPAWGPSPGTAPTLVLMEQFAWNKLCSLRTDATERSCCGRYAERSRVRILVSLKLITEGRSSMGSTTDKIKGATNEAVGKAKQGIGEAVGSDRLQGEGGIQEVKGKARQAGGDAKKATKDAANKAAAAANKNL